MHQQERHRLDDACEQQRTENLGDLVDPRGGWRWTESQRSLGEAGQGITQDRTECHQCVCRSYKADHGRQQVGFEHKAEGRLGVFDALSNG